MIRTLITSQTRIKLLRKFFLNSSITSHLRGLEAEFGDSSNAIRVELNRFEEAGLLLSFTEGNKKLYLANREHPLFIEIHNMIVKETGLYSIVGVLSSSLSGLASIYLTGDLATGKNSDVIDLVVVGDSIDDQDLRKEVVNAQDITGKKINCKVVASGVAEAELSNYEPARLLTLWNNTGMSMAI
jgi:hypothetical protein